MEEEGKHFRNMKSTGEGPESEESLASLRPEQSREELGTREPAEPQSGESWHVGP